MLVVKIYYDTTITTATTTSVFLKRVTKDSEVFAVEYLPFGGAWSKELGWLNS